jgi:hypothetical protein
MTAKAARAQGALAIASLVAAVIVTVVLVASPVSSRPAQGSSGIAAALPSGIKVEIRGGDPFVAYGLADRLTGAGAALHAVQPAADGNPVEPATMIVYYDRGNQASAERVKALLGRGTLRHQQVFEPGVDVTIVLGKDLSRL